MINLNKLMKIKSLIKKFMRTTQGIFQLRESELHEVILNIHVDLLSKMNTADKIKTIEYLVANCIGDEEYIEKKPPKGGG